MNAFFRVPFRLTFAALLLGAGTAAHADRIQNPLPALNETTTYAIQGGGQGILGSTPDSGLPIDLSTSVIVRRTITDLKDGNITAEEKMTSQQVRINGRTLNTSPTPTLQVTTDPSGKVIRVLVNGQVGDVPTGPANIQSVLAIWRLPNREYRPGEAWSQTVPLSARDDNGKEITATFDLVYKGMKSVQGRKLMQLTSHLHSPVRVKPTDAPVLGGMKPGAVTVAAVDQTSYFDPQTGNLVSADTQVTLDTQVNMAQGFNFPMVAHVPMILHTALIKNEPEAGKATSPQPLP